MDERQQENLEMFRNIADTPQRAHDDVYAEQLEKAARYNEAVEILANYAHEAWANYMRYFLEKCRQPDGGFAIPYLYLKNLERQIRTPYADLPAEEQLADQMEAHTILERIKYE